MNLTQPPKVVAMASDVTADTVLAGRLTGATIVQSDATAIGDIAARTARNAADTDRLLVGSTRT